MIAAYELTYRLLLSAAKQNCNCQFVMMVGGFRSAIPVDARLARYHNVGLMRPVCKGIFLLKNFLSS
jgi:hypothetical protein